MKTYPDVPVVVVKLALSTTQISSMNWSHDLKVLLQALQAMNRDGVSGQILVSAVHDGAANALLTMWFLNHTDITQGERLMQPFFAMLSQNGTSNSLSSRALSRLTSSYRQVPDKNPTNNGIVAGSVVLSNELFNSKYGPDRIAQAFADLPMAPGDLFFTSNLGGRVVAMQDGDNTAMHPGWRSSAHLVSYIQTVQPSFEAKASALDRLTHELMPLLYSIDPEFRLSYRNVGDPNENDFQRVYWGPKYGRLRRVKNKWDPEDLFICKLGVGSEQWDDQLFCRNRPRVVDRILDWVRGYMP
ncbi:oxidoreductase [Penicillium lagena]|uniref:oxidoreductase n=1 Tax=Penicillium lagena TaxID=94218 RepID=UPI00253FFECC|nr:oxidoreductase [Penicillium lagena]KAJ5612599.1 oxidoreductase [Penicillium lagena]